MKIVLPRVLVVLSLFTLLCAAVGGLARLGEMSFHSDHLHSLALYHGPLMVSGFLGTVISLERARAFSRLESYLAPGLKAIGTVLLVTKISPLGGMVAWIGGDLALLTLLLLVFQKQRELFNLALACAAGHLLAGDLLFAWGFAVSRFVLIWAGFLVLTISAERLELGRLVRMPLVAHQIFLALMLLFPVGAILSPTVAGACLLGFALWMIRYDVATRTIRLPGLPRFMASCLLSGNLWLGVGGLVLLWKGLPVGGPDYDAALHCIFLGFVFSMILGHAPIILPAVAGIRIHYHHRLYVSLAALNLSLILRVVGDLLGRPDLRQWGSWGNGATLLIFVGIMASVAISSANGIRPRLSPAAPSLL